MRDRRIHPRVEDSRRVSIALIPERPSPDRGLTMLSAAASNLSRNGIELHTYSGVPEEAFVRIDIPASGYIGDRALSLSGIVRWCRLLPGDQHYTVGVEFFDLADVDRQAWIEYSRRLFE